MQHTLADILASHDGDDSLIQHAVRYLIAEMSEDMCGLRVSERHQT